MIAPEGVPTDKDGDVKLNRAAYKPPRAVRNRIRQVKRDFEVGYQNMHTDFREFSHRTVQQYRDDCRDAFNTYVPPKSNDPATSWQAQTTRPVTRNKLTSIAAHILSSLIVPTIVAQNENDERDMMAENIMSDLFEYVRHNTEYEKEFVNVVMKALVSPAAIVHVDFYEIMRTIKEPAIDGGYNIKEIADDVLSGFKMNLRDVDNIYIANPYEKNIQKQRFLIDQKIISYDEFTNRFRDNGQADFITPGVKYLYIEDQDEFYEHSSDNIDLDSVELLTYYNHASDLELRFANGVLMDDVESPIRQKRHLYPYAKGGYEPVNEGEFFYYKSAADKLGPDQKVVDKLYNMVLDGAFLNTISPIVTYGEEEIQSDVFVPGSIHSFNDTDSKVDTLSPASDINSGMAALNKVEQSLTESSVDPQMSGISTPGEKTAFEVSQIEQNASRAMGLFGRMLSILVQDIGELQKDLILQHYTVAEVREIVGDSVDLQFQSFLVPEDDTGLKRRIKFISDELPTDDQELLDQSFEMLEAEGIDSDQRLFKVNAPAFRNMNFYCFVTADSIQKENKSMRKALELEKYDRMIQNPMVDQKEVTRDMIEVFEPGNSKKYMRKQQPQGSLLPGGQQNVNDNMASQMTGNNNMTTAVSRNNE